MKTKNPDSETEKNLTCGLVMPISSIDGCTSDHWIEVKNIITEAVECITKPQFTVKLVSDADDVGVIQKRIVQNIYNSDIIVCDVSGKNPNVMFELGMRLAFDKPTVIIKDDKTDYLFDTGIIEHVPYPRDLRFTKIVMFKSMLADKIVATHKAAMNTPDHSTFLKNFGKFQVANLAESIIPADKLVLEMLADLQNEVTHLRRSIVRDRDTNRVTKIMNIEKYALIQKGISKFRALNPEIKLHDILRNKQELIDFLAQELDAPTYFPDYREFSEKVDSVLNQILITEGYAQA